VLVTRCPCVVTEDAHVLRVLTERPPAMVEEAWAWLQQRHFGTLYFPRGGAPRPEDLSGDTDGDLYLVCWDAEILQHVSRHACARPLANTPQPPTTPPETKRGVSQRTPSTEGCEKGCKSADAPRLGDDWLERAQAHMRDPARLREQLLIGALYRQMQKAEDERSDDFLPLARAYKAAIDHGKHGGELLESLPPHLRARLVR